MENTTELLRPANCTPANYSLHYASYIQNLLSKIDHQQIDNAIQALLEARQAENTIFCFGNGGSSSTASHLANDISIGTRTFSPPFRVMSLTSNDAVVTALGNDVGYDSIFEHQLKTLLRPNDVVIAISASGNSPNIVKAVKYAKEKGAKVIGLSGFDGGTLKELSSIPLHVETLKGEYGPVEDIHMIFVHLIGTFLQQSVKQTYES